MGVFINDQLKFHAHTASVLAKANISCHSHFASTMFMGP